MTDWKRGDHIRADRVLYWHHGIYAGEGRVIHFSGTGSEKANAAIRYDSYEAFSKGDSVERVDYVSCNTPDETIAIAELLLARRDYSLVFNNCEHFCSYCKTHKRRSAQVENTRACVATAAGGGAGAVAAVGAVSIAGSTAGASTVAGVTSGLAAIGAGLAGGVIAVAAAPAVLTTAIACFALDSSDEHLPERERQARLAAKLGTGLGGAAGTAATVAAVSMMGTTAGIGTVAGVTSGLAAVGGTLAGGVAVAAAAPVVVAGLIGYAVYKFFRK
jgi:hypothetical protein